MLILLLTTIAATMNFQNYSNTMLLASTPELVLILYSGSVENQMPKIPLFSIEYSVFFLLC